MNFVGVFVVVFFIILSCYVVGYQHGKDKAFYDNSSAEVLK